VLGRWTLEASQLPMDRDCRRTPVGNRERGHVPRSVAMKPTRRRLRAGIVGTILTVGEKRATRHRQWPSGRSDAGKDANIPECRGIVPHVIVSIASPSSRQA
jgi:hypothetical protein